MRNVIGLVFHKQSSAGAYIRVSGCRQHGKSWWTVWVNLKVQLSYKLGTCTLAVDGGIDFFNENVVYNL